MNDKGAIAQYRDFRQQLLNKIAEDKARTEQRRYLTEPCPRGFAAGRRTIVAFRQAVAEQAIELLQVSLDSDSIVRRALRICPSVPLQQDTMSRLSQNVLFFLPTSFAVHRARHLLRHAGTLEGRKLLFELHIQRTLPDRQRYYDDSLDFALRRFDEIRSREDLDTLDHMESDLLKVAHRLGLKTPAEVRKALLRGMRRQDSRLLWLLVCEGVIHTIAELPWASEPSPWPNYNRVDDEYIPPLRNTLRCLLDHGVGREQVASILHFSLWALNPEELSNNLNFLKSASISDPSGMMEQLGERLWRTPTTTWRFVVETIGVNSVSELARFKRLLDCNHKLSGKLVHELVSLGAKQDDLVAFQRLLAEFNPEEHETQPLIDNIRLLAAPPHALSIGQLSQCSPYILGGSDLAPFLRVLAQHGLGGAQETLEFQSCFKKVSSTSLDRVLSILGARGKDEPLAQVITWVMNAGQGGYFDAYDYLVATCKMESLESLQQALRLVQLGVPFLQHLVEARGIGSIKEIRRWYYKARGIEGYRSRGSAYDELDTILLDDAFARNQFNHLEANQFVINNVVRHRIEQQLGALPWQSDEPTKNSYRRASEALAQKTRNYLLPSVQAILRSTDGVILPTLLEEDSDGTCCLEHKLSCLKPLLVRLMNGHGPSEASLTALETDAIALIYRTPAETVRTMWPQIMGRESDIQQLQLLPHYPMVWQQVRWQLRKELDRSGFTFLLNAACFAQRFRSDTYHDMFTACQHLRPKPLRPDFKPLDVGNAALHLGSLLAVAQDHDGVRQWIRDGFEVLARMDKDSLDAYQRLGDLIDFFNVLLPDALDANAEDYVARLSQEDSLHWAMRLGPCDVAGTGHAKLHAMLRLTRAKVLPLYLSWAKQQYRRYKKDEGDNLESQSLVAFASKHPAAFFAKSAVRICSASKVDMWREERLFHLVVFDPDGQRLAGMALIYVQDMPEFDRTRRSLIIRAINPTDEMLAGHSAESIVESFFDVAVKIAVDNSLSCVAFPSPSGAHLMSNRAPIDRYIEERYIKRASRMNRSGDGVDYRSPEDMPQQVDATFYAYEHGQELIKTLYVIWSPTNVKNKYPHLDSRLVAMPA